jgi:acyl-CoA thioesterase
LAEGLDPAEDVEPWARAMWERDTLSRSLGMQLVAARPGRAVVRMGVRPDMLQGHGSVHGGMLFSLADTAFAFCCNGPDRVVVAASADVTFVAPADAGEVLVATAEEDARWGRNGLTRVRVEREDDGTLVALFQGRSREVGPRR